MKRLAALGVLLLSGALCLALTQTPQPQQPQVAEIQKVRDRLYMVTGGGGNTAAFLTAKGVIVVDTKNPGWGPRILEKIKSVTDKPVTMIINTHTHGDHVSGNVDFPANVDIVAHENCKARMETMPLFQTDAGKKFLPKRTYKDKLTLLGGADRIDLYYFGRGHTGGDSIIVFPALKVAHTGDLFAAKALPIMDTNNGGSGLEYGKTMQKVATKIKGVETVIAGHTADPLDWKAVQDYAAFMQAFVSAVETAAKAGKTAEQAMADLKLPDRFKDYGMQRLKADVGVIYQELKK